MPSELKSCSSLSKSLQVQKYPVLGPFVLIEFFGKIIRKILLISYFLPRFLEFLPSIFGVWQKILIFGKIFVCFSCPQFFKNQFQLFVIFWKFFCMFFLFAIFQKSISTFCNFFWKKFLTLFFSTIFRFGPKYISIFRNFVGKNFICFSFGQFFHFTYFFKIIYRNFRKIYVSFQKIVNFELFLDIFLTKFLVFF